MCHDIKKYKVVRNFQKLWNLGVDKTGYYNHEVLPTLLMVEAIIYIDYSVLDQSIYRERVRGQCRHRNVFTPHGSTQRLDTRGGVEQLIKYYYLVPCLLHSWSHCLMGAAKFVQCFAPQEVTAFVEWASEMTSHRCLYKLPVRLFIKKHCLVCFWVKNNTNSNSCSYCWCKYEQYPPWSVVWPLYTLYYIISYYWVISRGILKITFARMKRYNDVDNNWPNQNLPWVNFIGDEK